MAGPGRPPGPAVDRESRQQLDAQEEKEMVRRMVAKELRNHTELGTTAPRVAKALGIALTTARLHLDHLVAVGEAYKHEMGPRMFIYLPNGRLAHPIREEPFEIAGRHYTFKFVRNAFGDMVLMQERSKDAWGHWVTVGGIAVPMQALKQFAEKLERICKEHDIKADQVASA